MARKIAAIRGHGLVLVYHRVAPTDAPAGAVVPFLPLALFLEQVEALREVGEVVTLGELLEAGDRPARPRFALTFDDDYLSHAEHVLPALRARGLPAAFFLSGRTLHGMGSYWFEQLERLIEVRGMRGAGALLGIHTDDPGALAMACEGERRLQDIVKGAVPDEPRHLGPDHMRALRDANMTIGFHTLRHSVLTWLMDEELGAALTEGRQELEAVAGPLRFFAYPHGKGDARTAARVREAGFEAAWTGRPRPFRREDNRYLLGRWEPGPLNVENFMVAVGIRLNRPSPNGAAGRA